MSKIEIDFNNLKYNLYELLNVKPNDDESKIRKNFMKIIKKFHPDKNSELEKDIYYHIILGNQILLNKELRKKYDSYLQDKSQIFSELKESFNKTIKNQVIPDNKHSISSFNTKVNELNIKHGYNENINEPISIIDKYDLIKENRAINIKKENIKNIEDFNNKFNSYKADGKFKDQIIEYNDTPSELSTYTIGEQYTNLNDIDKLYIDDSIQSSKYSSLDRAFTLQPHAVLNNKHNNSDYKEKMQEYRNNTNLINKNSK
jgi:curved DNA-binding protein CbpA